MSTGKRLYGFSFLQPVFAPDGKTLAAVSLHQRQIVLCDAATGKQLHAFGFLGAFRCFAFAPDGKTLAALDGKGKHANVRLWDVNTHAAVSVLKADDASYPGFARLVFSRDGRRLACVSENPGTGFSDAVVRTWDVPAGRESTRLLFRSGPATPFALIMWSAPVQGALSDDGSTLAVTVGNSVRLFDAAIGKERHGHRSHLTHVTEVAVSPDGRQVATGGPDGMIHLWDAATRQVRMDFLDDRNAAPRLAFAADGKALTSGSVLWELLADDQVWVVRPQQTPPQGSDIRALSPDGRIVAWVTQEGIVSLRDRATNRDQARLDAAWDPRQQPWNGRAVFSPNGKRFALVAMAGNEATIVQWDIVTGRKLPTLAGMEPTIGEIAYSPDGRILAVLSNGKGDDAGAIRLGEAASGKECLRLEPPGGPLSALAFAPDGRRLAVGFADGSIRVWDIATGKLLGRLDGHRGTVWSLRFSPDGLALYSGSADTTVLIWDMTRLHPAAAPALTAAELDAAWADLAGNDAAKAFRAVAALAGAPRQAVPFLGSRLKPIALDEKQVGRWIADLDSDEFDTREAALQELARRGELVEPAVQNALKGNVPLETRRRLEQLLKTLQAAPPLAELRVLRAVQTLELIGTPEARPVLEALAKGAAGAWQTREAREARERLARRAALDLQPLERRP